jgi:adenylate kinase
MLHAIIFLGAPGSGKGTTAEDMKAHSDYIHVSTGNMLREAMAEGHPYGLEAKEFITRGELVPDETVMKIVRERLDAGPSDARYLFDGFPRTEAQARLLDAFFEENNRGKVTHVFLLDVPQDILVDRIAGRRICKDCGAVYHVTNIRPKVEGICDKCGGELYQRPDDREETVLNRLDVYHKQTESLIGYYERKNVLCRIEAIDRNKTLQTILDTLEAG